MANAENANFKIQFYNGGDKATSGDGLWGKEGQDAGFAKFKAQNKVDDKDEWDNVCSNNADGVSVFVKTDLEKDSDIEFLASFYDSALIAGLSDVLGGFKIGAQLYAPNVAKFGDKSETKSGLLWGFGIENDKDIIDNTTLYLNYSGQKAKDNYLQAYEAGAIPDEKPKEKKCIFNRNNSGKLGSCRPNTFCKYDLYNQCLLS